MFHTPEHFIAETDEVSPKAINLSLVDGEIFATFTRHLEALMGPYTNRSGKFADERYEQMMPIASQLTLATAVLAAQCKEDKSSD